MHSPRIRIAIGVQSRFHAFELARALLALDCDVHVFCGDPRLGTPDPNFPADRIHRIAFFGYLTRLVARSPWARHPELQAWLHRWFGRWLQRQLLESGPFEVVHLFSSVALECLNDTNISGHKVLMRGSAHIDAQHALLSSAAARAQLPCEVPAEWVRERERAEYQRADRILVLSQFAYDSFIARGHAPAQIRIAGLGVDVAKFAASAVQHAARTSRARERQRLRVLTVGTFSLQKGALDLLGIWALSPFAEFRFVGGLADAAPLRRRAPDNVSFLGRLPQAALHEQFAWADVFLYPTIQDGFAAVLVQAVAAGLPILASTNCGAADLLAKGAAGMVLPIHAASEYVAQLQQLDNDRERLLALQAQQQLALPQFEWRAAAEAFLQAVTDTTACE